MTCGGSAVRVTVKVRYEMTLLVPLVGALLAFLPLNFPPARIFVGDTGALFLGYCLSLIALESYQRVTVVTFLVSLLVLAVPLLDTALSILRRLRQRSNVMAAAPEHIHHRLLKDFDGSHRPAVLSLYFLTACFSAGAVPAEAPVVEAPTADAAATDAPAADQVDKAS